MKVTFNDGDDIVYAEQNRRGRGEERDVNIYLNGSRIFLKAMPKCKTDEQLIRIAKRAVELYGKGKK